MKKFFTMAVLLLAAAILSGCVTPDLGTGMALKDCSSDQDCFEQAAETCEPAKLTVSEEDESSVMGLYSEIRGLEGDNCVFYLQITRAEMKNPGVDLTPAEQELFDQLQLDFKVLEGKDMLCAIPQNMMTEGDLLSMANPEELCTGSLITVVEQMQ